MFLDTKLHFLTHVIYIFSQRIMLFGLVLSVAFSSSSFDRLYILYFTFGRPKFEYNSAV
jgi:hypothetical protein